MAPIFPHIAHARTVGRYAVGIGLWIPALIFFVDNVGSFHLVRGPSMSPTLSRDFVFVQRWRATENLRRGQVVLFRSPMNPEKVAIKRILGLEGDVIKPRKPPPPPRPPLVTVPQGKVWVEGDEGFHSMDSNDYGPISRALITARVTYVVWPPSRAGRVGEKFAGRYGALVHNASSD